MTMSIANTAEDASPMRGLLPLWVGVGIYALSVLAGDQLLNDPTPIGRSRSVNGFSTNRTVPQTDMYSFTMHGQPWISTQWLAQVLLAVSHSIAGWAGLVVLAATSIALTFALLVRFLSRHLTGGASLAFIATAVALVAGHLLARPHVLALPVMVAWVGGLVAAMDDRKAPSFWLLPLMALWANLHGGFVLGLALVAPMAVDAVWNADAPVRKSLALRWALFAAAALLASCLTPYGWDALFGARRILNLGAALDLIGEWRRRTSLIPERWRPPLPWRSFWRFGAALVLPPIRVALVVGFVLMALGHVRNAEVLALLGRWLSRRRWHDGSAAPTPIRSPLDRRGKACLLAGLAIVLAAGTLAFASVHRFEPMSGNRGCRSRGAEEDEFQARVQRL